MSITSKMKISGVYIITCLVNGKYYVGESIDVFQRIKKHKEMLIGKRHQNIFLQRAVNKYGINQFSFELLEVYPQQVLKAMEHYWCYWLNAHDDRYGYNLRGTEPNDKLGRPHQSSIEKAAAKNRGRKANPESVKKAMETRMKTIQDRGYYFSEETIEIFRKQKTGKKYPNRKKYSEESLKNRAEAAKKRGVSPATLEKFIAASKNPENWRKPGAYKHSEETKQKIREKRKQQVFSEETRRKKSKAMKEYYQNLKNKQNECD